MSTLLIICPHCGQPHIKPDYDGQDEQEFVCVSKPPEEQSLFKVKNGSTTFYVSKEPNSK